MAGKIFSELSPKLFHPFVFSTIVTIDPYSINPGPPQGPPLFGPQLLPHSTFPTRNIHLGFYEAALSPICSPGSIERGASQVSIQYTYMLDAKNPSAGPQNPNIKPVRALTKPYMSGPASLLSLTFHSLLPALLGPATSA